MKNHAALKPILAGLAVFALVLCIAGAVSGVTHRQTIESERAQFAARADSLAAQISRELEVTVATIQAGASAVRLSGDTNGDVLRDRLYAFLEDGDLLSSSPAIRNVGLVMNGAFGAESPDAPRFPLVGIYPDTNSRLIGADLSFSPERMAAIDYAIETGQAGVGRRITLLSGIPGVFFAQPIYAPGEVPTEIDTRRRQTVGLIVAVLATDSFMINALSDIDLRGIDFEVHDLGSEASDAPVLGTETLLASSRLDKMDYKELSPDARLIAVAPSALQRDVTIGGHVWRILLVPKTGAASQHGGYVALIIGCVGFFLAALSGFASYQKFSQAVLLKSRVDERTHDLQTAYSQIAKQANEDSLTGLGNRRSLTIAIQSMIEGQSHRAGKSIAAVHIDLDRFKQINDTMGHAGGDFILRHVADIIRRSFPNETFCARVGGDEFTAALVIEDRNVADLEAAAARLVDACSQPVTFDGRPCRFGASVGIATQSLASVEPKELLVNADLALYRAKEDGRGRIQLFSPEIQAEVVAHKERADDILRAIDAGDEFVPFFQPQICCITGNLYGVEALARWVHPKLGILPPSEFIPIAEDLDVVAKIDRLVLESAIYVMNRAEGEGHFVAHLSTNLSFSRLMEGDFTSSISNLPKCNCAISFEILESIFLDDEQGPAMWNIDSIRDAGMEVQIDDFGSGRASVVALTRVAPSRMKIDRELVAPIAEYEERRRLVQSIVEIGKVLEIGVTAEGVETPAQAQLLRDMGCDVLQGYLFAPPLSEAELMAYLRRGQFATPAFG
ncbi:MAG: EAL domain-containing protein [Pseudomonadota bacterium]